MVSADEGCIAGMVRIGKWERPWWWGEVEGAPITANSDHTLYDGPRTEGLPTCEDSIVIFLSY